MVPISASCGTEQGSLGPKLPVSFQDPWAIIVSHWRCRAPQPEIAQEISRLNISTSLISIISVMLTPANAGQLAGIFTGESAPAGLSRKRQMRKTVQGRSLPL